MLCLSQKKVIGKRENGRYKVLFVCSDCSKLDKLLYVYCTVEVHNIDHEEDDEYVVDGLASTIRDELIVSQDNAMGNLFQFGTLY